MIGKSGKKKKNKEEEEKGKNRRGGKKRTKKKKEEKEEEEAAKHSKQKQTCLSLHIRMFSPQTKPCDNHETGIVFALLSNRDFCTLVQSPFQSPPD